MTSSSVTASSDAIRRRVGWSSFLGTKIEYYDFLLYSAAAAVIFNKIFFPALDPALGTIAALATLAVGYTGRLAGGLLFGHLGDKYGRKSVLMATMLVMGLSSGLIGLLPTYAEVGWVAGVLLLVLRVFQGLAAGGEYGGAVLMTAEHAKPGRRGLATSAVSMGAPTGSVLATGTMALITLLPEPQLLAWGWRVPFLFSFALLGLGLYLRYRVAESPVFLAARKESAPGSRAVPIVALLRRNPRQVLRGLAMAIGPFCGMGVLFVYMPSYATSIGYGRSQALLAVTIGTIASIGTAALFAVLSDKYGRRPVMLYCALATAVIVFPVFWLVNTGNPVLLTIAITLYTALVMIAGPTVMVILLSELFDTDVRYTGTSLVYQLSQMLGAGFSPVIAASLIALAGGGTNIGLVAGFVVIIALASSVAIWRAPETRDASLTTVGRRAEPVADVV
jgi:MHS family shikimate/dehydroshikimate transporter-like MFS transporter